MKKIMLVLLLSLCAWLAACEKNPLLSEQTPITNDEVSTDQQTLIINDDVSPPKQPIITDEEENIPDSKDTHATKTSLKDKIGIKLNAVSAVDLSAYKSNEELILSDSPSATFIMTTDSVLTDFIIQHISYDGIQCELKEALYHKKIFDPSMSLKVNAYLPDTFSNLLISYKKEGRIYRFYLNSNLTGEGNDASLQPATIGGHLVSDPSDDLSWTSSVDQVTLSDEVNVNFIFSSDTKLQNLQFISVSYNGEKCQLGKTLYSVPNFDANAALKISTYLPDMFSNLLIRYENEEGHEINWLANYNMSGEGPEVMLENANSILNQ